MSAVGDLSAARHVPRIALDWIEDRPEERWRRVEGSMVFADISGFTALSERLATKGRIGAEELVETLSGVFGAMIDTAAERGGQLLKFGGDALLFLFDGDDHAVQAASTAVEMRAELRGASKIRTSVGRLSLSISIGVHSGEFDLFLVGSSHRELIVLGPGTSEVVATEDAADAGQILVSSSTAALLPAGSARPRTDGALVLRWRAAPVPPTADAGGRPNEDAAQLLLPTVLARILEGSRPDPAHRVATIAFMKFTGTDAMLAGDGPVVLADRLHATISIAQQAFEAEDVALLCVDCDADGGKIFCSSGVPVTSEDDEGRMLRAARAIVEAAPPMPLQIGINRGHVFAAEIGTDRRSAFSAMGDTTNTAARICGKAEPGSIYAHPDVLEHSRVAYEARPVGPFSFKGKTKPQMLYELGEEIGSRQHQRHAATPLVGRATELDTIETVLAQAERGRGGGIVIEGAVGVGKTRLVDEALAGWSGDVVSMHAEPYGTSNAYRVFRDACRELLEIERGPLVEMAAQLRERIDRIAPELTPWLALIADVAQIEVDPSNEVIELLPEYRPDRTADVVIEVLDLVRSEPTVFLIEDAHWTDTASAHLANRLVRAARSRPWAVIAVRRTGVGGVEISESAAVELDVLDDDDLRSIVNVLTEASPLRPLEVDTIVERAAGNPLFASELISVLREAGSQVGVPDSLQGALAAQVDALDPLARRVLSYASVLGRSFRRRVLQTVLEREGMQVDEATIDRLARFLEADGPRRWRFRNGLVRDVTYEGLGYRLRERLHRTAGEAVETISDDPVSDADVLALHFFAATDHRRALHYSDLAAQRAERSHAYPAAITSLERAVESSRRLPDVSPDARVGYLVRLGVARDQAGLLRESLDAYATAIRLVDDPVRRAEVALQRAHVRERAGSFPAALRESTLIRRSLEGSGADEAARLRARCAAFSALVRQRQDRPDLARRAARAAIAEAEEAHVPGALARALGVLCWSRLVTGEDDPLRDADRAIDLFAEVGDRLGLANMANNLGVYAYYTSDWAETLRSYARAEAAFRSIGNVTDAAIAAANTGEVLVNQGRFDEAEPPLREASRVLRSSGRVVFATFAEMHLGRLLTGRGELDEAEAVLRRCVDDNVEVGGVVPAYEAALHLADCLIDAGRGEEALGLIEAAAERVHEDVSIFDAARALVEARALAASGDEAAAVAKIEAGIEVARQRDLSFDLARLYLLADRHGLAGDRIGSERPLEAGEQTLRALGVVAP